MAELKIIRASAGSGKTYSLTEEILKILIDKPIDYFKHILAVTFTNKATAEMKSRILEELFILGSSQASNHLTVLLSSSSKTEAEVRNKAKIILHRILHGYTWFRVETIDTFFQGIIRSFVREIGIAGNYNIELNQEKVLIEAIDRLLDKLGEDKEMLNWLLEHIDSKIAEGKSWTVANELLDLGKTLFRETLITKLPEIEILLKEGAFLKTYKNALNDIIKSYENRIIEKSEKALKTLENNQLEISDFSYTSSGPAGFLNKINQNNFDSPGPNVKKVLESGKWASAKCTRKLEAENIGTNTIAPAINEINEIINTEGKDYYTATIILKNLHIMGMLSRLNEELSGIREEKSIFLISDASPFIQKIINNNDTPFIYEKVGNHFNHLLIDEFQDTSSMQWDNFKPLIDNSLSKDHSCLLVGDVKQSIYRWRSSNWDILESQVKEEFNSYPINEINLETNWRSDENIIEFNNSFFKKASSILDLHLSESKMDIIYPGHIYKDVAQKTPNNKKSKNGYINIKIFNKTEISENEEYFKDELIERINETLNQGFQPGDIAILIRNKKEGTLLANNIVNASKNGKFNREVGVISNESLFLISSPTVQLLVSAMQFINTPDSELIAAKLLANYLHLTLISENNIINFPLGIFNIELLDTFLNPNFIELCKALKQESLYGIVEKLSLIFKLYDSENDLVYIHSFLDLVFNYSTSEQADLSRFLNFWEEEGYNKTISAAESTESIRILTIHKSKGLQFPVVIVPFASWSIVPKPNEKLWLQPKESPYDKLPFLPVNFSKELATSIFKSDYETENYLTLVDNLNLLYVAFTRAENTLITFLSQENQDLKRINDLIINSLNNLDDKLGMLYNGEEKRYIIGHPSKKLETKEISESKIMPGLAPTGTVPMVRINSRAADFTNENPKQRDQASFGRILHSIMEDCLVKGDISKAVQSKVEEGILSQSEGLETKELLIKAMEHEMVTEWFNNKYTILTEADIISPGGKVKRPDRVMLGHNNAIVVDYKFGQEDDKPKHMNQVKEYMRLIKETSIENVTGYIWYIMENDVVPVGM